jgi:hypothetical protein
VHDPALLFWTVEPLTLSGQRGEMLAGPVHRL